MLDLAHVFQNILEIHMKAVDPSASSTLIVQLIKRVLITNVLIHALAHVVVMLSVKLCLIYLGVPVYHLTLEIHSVIALQFLLNQVINILQGINTVD